MTSPKRRLVAFAPYGRRSGSSRARPCEWIDHLRLQATVHPFTEESTAGFREIVRRPLRSWKRHQEIAARAIGPDDIVLIHREVSPFSDGRAEEPLLRASAWGIVDFDDGLQWDWGHGGYSRRFRPKSPKMMRMVKAADVVIADNDLIAEWAGQYARQVVVIPTCVEPSRYKPQTGYSLNDPPLIGWIGSSSTESHLRSWENVLLQLNRETGARLVLIGAGDLGETPLKGITDWLPWSEDRSYAFLSQWDIGIMPMPDGLFERSKCGYKLLQYGASSLPSVGSTVGVNAEILGDGNAEDGRAIVELLRSTAERRRLVGERASAVVHQRYAFEVHSDRFSELLDGLPSKVIGR